MRLRRIALGLACAALLVPGAPAAAEPPRPGACTPAETPSDDHTDDTACLAVDVALSHAPKVGATALVTVEVRSTAAPSPVSLEIHLPAGLEWARPPAGLSVSTAASPVPADRGKAHRATGRSVVGDAAPWRVSGTVRAVAAGPAEIRASAADPHGDGARDSAFLTVGTTASRPGIEVREASAAASADRPGTAAFPGDARPAGEAAATAGTACATGSWNYVDHTGVRRTSANARVQVWDTDPKGPADLLATGLTAADGGFQLCFDNTDEDGTGQDVSVHFRTENDHWKIQNPRTRKAYAFVTPTRANVGATVDVGAFQPAAPELMRAVEAFDTVNAAWNWLPSGTCWDPNDGTCRPGTINWAPDSTTCCWYNLRENTVYLDAVSPDLHNLVLHEWGHYMMDDLYEDAFPDAPNCSPHYLHRASSEGCAWTEGWATWFGDTVLNDPAFRWADGRVLDLESPTWGSTPPAWENGDTVEGRVMGSMWDLADPTNEPGDTCSEDPKGPLWNTSVNHVTGTFRQFWQQRAGDGYDVGPTALSCLYHNTIDY